MRWVCTQNPFYVVSAGLFLAGLKISFGDPANAEDTWGLMGGLAGYTLLLAGTACLLVRFANVWDDVRTVLLLAVLMFLATSVTFDEVLVLTPGRGFVCYLVGLLFAGLVSEGILRGIRLALPAWFRVPYYLILAVFFLYPLALRAWVDQPQSEALQWALFGFSPTAGLVFLTLLPAIRRGPDYVRGSGSPWAWPLYPWTLFGLLALAVPARTFLLCWSMHLLGNGDSQRVIFGPYFLVPFGLVVAVLLLEMGLVSRQRGVLLAALAVPAGLFVLASVGHRSDPVYQGFLEVFAARLGGYPSYATLLAALGFSAYAILRRVPLAVDTITVVLLALAVVAPETRGLGELVAPQPTPLLAAAAVQLGLGVWRRVSWRCLLGSLAAGAGLAVLSDMSTAPLRGPLAFHLALLAVLLVGALFDDPFARLLRGLGAFLVLGACLRALLVPSNWLAPLPPEALTVYPLIMAALLTGYGLWLRHRPALAIAALALVAWLAAAAWQGYSVLRQLLVGLDYLAVSLALFAVALLISLGKSGILARLLSPPRGRTPPAMD
jgi:hypothetical protein